MADHCFQFLRRNLSDITQVDLMMQALICDIQRITLLLHIPVHLFHGGRFVIIGSDVHTLYAKAFVTGQEFRL